MVSLVVALSVVRYPIAEEMNEASSKDHRPAIKEQKVQGPGVGISGWSRRELCP